MFRTRSLESFLQGYQNRIIELDGKLKKQLAKKSEQKKEANIPPVEPNTVIVENKDFFEPAQNNYPNIPEYL